MTQCSWAEGHLKVSVSWSPGPCQSLTPLLSPDPIAESAYFQHRGCNQRAVLDPTGRAEAGRLLRAVEATAELTPEASALCSRIQEEEGLGGHTAGGRSGCTCRLHLPSPHAQPPVLTAPQLPSLASFFKGNRLWPARCPPRPGRFSVDSVVAIWPEHGGDFLSHQLWQEANSLLREQKVAPARPQALAGLCAFCAHK